MLIEQLEVGNFGVYAYVLGCRETGEGIIVDAADEVQRILDLAGAMGITTITGIVCTHAHADHTGGNRLLKELTGAPILVHEADAERLAHPSEFVLQIFQCEASPPADRTVSEGDRIAFGREHVTVIHTPGHSPGSMCLYSPGYVVTGDTLFVGAVGRWDLPGGSYPQLIDSIRKRLLPLPPDTVVLPGHNYGTSPRSTIHREARTNPFLTGEM